MKRLRLWSALALLGLVAAGMLWVWWELGASGRPMTLAKNQTQIAGLLNGAGWVSPHLTGPRLYMLAYRDCAACTDFETREFPKLQAAGVDTRVIMIARPGLNGQARSSPVERSTVAELWVNRSWALYQRWMAVPPSAWTAPGLAPADGDAGRAAVIEAGRALPVQLSPLLKTNGLKFAYPTFIWWNKAGQMRGCACSPRNQDAVARELGA